MDQGRPKEFRRVPGRRRERIEDALTLASEGRNADIAKPMKGRLRGFRDRSQISHGRLQGPLRLQVADDIWVIHAFQKKAKTGIKTPQKDVDLIK